MNVRTSLGKRIRLLRKARKISIERLAEMTDLSVTFVGTVERGRNCPSIKTCQEIAAALGVPLWELFHFARSGRGEEKIQALAMQLRRGDALIVETLLAVGEILRRHHGAESNDGGPKKRY